MYYQYWQTIVLKQFIYNEKSFYQSLYTHVNMISVIKVGRLVDI